MNTLDYYVGTLGLSSTLMLGLTLYRNGWHDYRTYCVNLYNGPYTILYGIMGASLCGIGAHHLINK